MTDHSDNQRSFTLFQINFDELNSANFRISQIYYNQFSSLISAQNFKPVSLNISTLYIQDGCQRTRNSTRYASNVESFLILKLTNEKRPWCCGSAMLNHISTRTVPRDLLCQKLHVSWYNKLNHDLRTSAETRLHRL